MTPVPVKRWIIDSQDDDLSGLKYVDGVLGSEVGPDDVLVEMRAGSINYRDLVIGKVNPPSLISQQCVSGRFTDLIPRESSVNSQSLGLSPARMALASSSRREPTRLSRRATAS